MAYQNFRIQYTTYQNCKTKVTFISQKNLHLKKNQGHLGPKKLADATTERKSVGNTVKGGKGAGGGVRGGGGGGGHPVEKHLGVTGRNFFPIFVELAVSTLFLLVRWDHIYVGMAIFAEKQME